MYGDKIAGLREKMGLTQEELAEKIGITRASLSHYEKNRREPDFAILNRFADFFGVSVDELLGRDTKHTPKQQKKPQDLKRILEQHEIMFDGVPIDDEAKEDILHIVEFELYKRAKAMNKRKPKENK